MFLGTSWDRGVSIGMPLGRDRHLQAWRSRPSCRIQCIPGPRCNHCGMKAQFASVTKSQEGGGPPGNPPRRREVVRCQLASTDKRGCKSSNRRRVRLGRRYRVRSTGWGMGGWIHGWKPTKRVSGRACSQLVRSTDTRRGGGSGSREGCASLVYAHPAVSDNHVSLAAFASATNSGAHLEGSG